MNKLKMENELLIRKIAWSFSTSTGLEFDDLFQEASLAYLEALKTYDPDKGRITTHLWHCVHNQLKNYLKLQNKEKVLSIEDVEIGKTVNNIPFWEELNSEAQEIAEVVLDSPKDFLNVPADEAQIQLTKIMLQKGWNWIKICSGIKNLRAIYA
jgi:RNA polymerase sigma factor (sigma-70 family)